MALADTAALIASLSLKDGFTGPLKKIDRSLSQFDAHLSKTQNRGFKAGQQIGTGIKNGAKIAAVGIGLLATQVVAGLNSLSKLEDAQAQTEAVLKSTGGVAGQTASSVRALAEQYENLNATIDDKVIQSGENLLLTFTKIGPLAFQPALQAALDLNQALGKGEEGLQGTIIQVGKALNDPIKGMTALRKVGVSFTADQIDLIKTLEATGDHLGAQQIILKELSTEFGGSFARAGQTATGTLAGIGDAVEDLQKAIATGLFPVLLKVLPKVRDFLTSPRLLADVEKLGNRIASLFSDSNINQGVALLTGFFDSARKLAPALQSAAEITGRVVKTAVDAFKSLPPEIQSLAIAGLAINKLTGGLVTNIAGGLISAVISSFKGLMNVNAASVIVNGPVAPGIPGGGGPGGGLLSTVSKVAIPVAIIAIGSEAALLLSGINDDRHKFVTPEGDTKILRGTNVLDERIANTLNNIKSLQERADHGDRDAQRKLTAQKTVLDGLLDEQKKSNDRSYDAIENMRTKIANDTLNVDVQNTSALAKAIAGENVKGIQEADRIARGIKNTGPSKSVTPRLKFLAGNASDSKDVAVAQALALGFERNRSPAFKSDKALIRSIDVLRRDQKTLGPKAAAKVGGYIDRMKAELARRQAQTIAAIKAQKVSFTANVTIPTSTYINGRLLDASTGRFKTTIVGHKGAFAEFG